MAIRIAAVIPSFNVGNMIARVLTELPEMIGTVIVVDDGSTDNTAAIVEECARRSPRIQLIRHEKNRGVGAAMVTGFRKALLDRADVIVKIDGDGQMPLDQAPNLIAPLLSGEADYAKGNRFRDFAAIRQMPLVRRIGNLALSFLAKAATGYWHCFDPTNGFIAIRGDVLAQLPLEKIDEGYYFETSMLGHLYLVGAVVKDVPMPARYAGEASNLSVVRVLHQFPGRLSWALFRRLTIKHFVYDFDLESLHLLFGSLLLGAGVIYGGYNWWWHYVHQMVAPTGTVVLSALLVILGFQLLLSAVNLDFAATPRQPINGGPIGSEAELPRFEEMTHRSPKAV